MMMGMLNPNQKQLVEMFKNKPDNEKAQTIADYCNKNGISKDQLQDIINIFSK